MTAQTTDTMLADVVLFDLDGTLTDSAPGIVAGIRHALAAVGAPEPSPESLRTVIGPPLIEIFATFGLSEQDNADAVAAYHERYRARGWAENSVFDGIDAVLTEIRVTGVTLGVATSKNEDSATRILEHFGLAPYFDAIAGASDDGTRRAKADVIERALILLGRTPVRAADGGTPGVVMIGDRSHYVEGAAQFGIPTIAVDWGYGSDDERALAHGRVGTPAELVSALSRLALH